MEITWLGRSCFRLKGRDGAVVMDPCPPESGYRIGKVDAEIATISRIDDPGYSYREAVKGDARFLDAPGEYEVGGILVTGIAMPRGDEGRSISFIVEIDGIRIGHLGLPAGSGKPPLDDFKGVDVLLLPVGGYNSLSAAAAADVMTTIDARVTIPMNYRTEQETLDLEPLERFLKETGAKPEPQPRLQVTRSSLPADLTVVVLQPRS